MKIIKKRERPVFASVLSIINLLFFVSVSFVSGGATPAFAEQVDMALDSDKDGLTDVYENKIGTEPYLSDTDGDGLDDGLEVGKNLQKPLDHDADKRIDALDPDDDNDGLPTILEVKSGIDLDTDKDGIKNYLDTDSDNDAVDDGREAGMLGQDSNFDKIDDAFDAYQKGVEDKNGDGIADSIVMPDHNQDGIVDMLDNKFQYGADKQKVAATFADKNIAVKNTVVKNTVDKNPADKNSVNKNNANKLTKAKLVKKSVKQIKPKTASKQNKPAARKIVVNKTTDSDNDGLLDSEEKILGTNPEKRDSDEDKVSDAVEIGLDPRSPQDSDLDGIIDALDSDDDNDGVLTKNEDLNKDGSPINDDTDEDGVPNYLDANDDGDTRLTIEEGGNADSDQDGIFDYLDKNDGVKDKDTQVVKKQELPDTPEVVVLYEGNQEDFDNKPFNIQMPEGLVEGQAELIKGKKVAAQDTIHDKHVKKVERVTQALEEAIANNKAQKLRGENSLFEGKLSKKKQVSLRHKERGFIPWLTSLLPD